MADEDFIECNVGYQDDHYLFCIKDSNHHVHIQVPAGDDDPITTIYDENSGEKVMMPSSFLEVFEEATEKVIAKVNQQNIANIAKNN